MPTKVGVVTVPGNNHSHIIFLIVILFIIWLSSSKRLTVIQAILKNPNLYVDDKGGVWHTEPYSPSPDNSTTLPAIPGIPTFKIPGITSPLPGSSNAPADPGLFKIMPIGK